jgi:RimJ/RimL family protein N-acetyltransferase
MVRLQQAIDCGSHVNFLHECYTSPKVQGDFQPTRAVSTKTVSEEILSQEENSRYLFIVQENGREIGYGYSFRSRAFNHFEIGVTLIPEERHKGFGLLAHRLLVVQTFVEYRAKRLIA